MKSCFFNKLIFLLTLINFIYISIYGQVKKNRYRRLKSFYTVDSLTSYRHSDIFNFPNLHKIRYYSDEKKLTQLHLMGESSQYHALKEYVSHFGIENFNRDLGLLWKLANLSEQQGLPGEALLLYKLILKHYSSEDNIEKVLEKYNLLELNRKEDYVSIEQYYDLVNYRKEIDTLRPPVGVLLNMGDLVNSDSPDYAPTVGVQDDLLLFTSKRTKHINQEINEDLFFTVKRDGLWQMAEPYTSINTSLNEGSASLSYNNKYFYFSRCNAPDSYGNCDLYVATRQSDGQWGDIKNLGANINSMAWESQPSLSKHGDTLFFASNRPGGFGGSDIYYAVKDRKGNWTSALNCGPIINTRGHEVSPFFHHRYNVLYFSSNGQPVTFGEFEIYKSMLNEGHWEEPKNIGPLVNGGGSEYYFTIDNESHMLYYAKSTEDDKEDLDLYAFPLPMGAHPQANVVLKGAVTNDKNRPVKGIVSIIDLDEGVEVAPKFLREDGTYNFSLINHRRYLLIIQGDDFFRIEKLLYLDGDREVNSVVEPLLSKIAFSSLEFEHGKSEILPYMYDDLSKLGNFMVDHPTFKLHISGHTDSAGNEEINRKLSQNRADAIAGYLVRVYKVDPKRITTVGYGSSRPIREEHTDEDRKINRRVEFEIVH